MNIVVLCAGTSTEREVSIVTGKKVCEALRKKGHNARVLDVFFGTYKSDINKDNFFDGEYDLEKEAGRIAEFSSELQGKMKERRMFFGENVLAICMESDIVFMALHGANGEDGKVQATLDLCGVKYTGSGYMGSALAMDKGMTKKMFLSENVPTPVGFEIKKAEGTDYVSLLEENNVTYPCVVKPCCGGSSIGVSIVNNDEEYKKALEESFSLEDYVIIEKYVKGREFSVGVIDGEALPIIEIIPLEGFYDYKNKYQPGMTKDVCPAEISEELTKRIQTEAVHAFEVLNLDNYARMDFLVDENEEIYCLEANTLPGMTPTSLLPQEAKAIGIEFPELCEKLIQVSMRG